jgi:ATP-dependent exoDNAse (exonuclease V) beta subunit
VHGAKGLQAPLVILPDTTGRMGEVKDKLVWGEETVILKMKEGVCGLSDRLSAAEAERLHADAMRGLYVAMTRAADWLVVCGWGKPAGTNCWYGLVKEAATEEAGWRDEGSVKVRGNVWETAPQAIEKTEAQKVPKWLETAPPVALVAEDAEW